MLFFFFFFSSRRRHTRFDCDWSSDVCSSDLVSSAAPAGRTNPALASLTAPVRALLTVAGDELRKERGHRANRGPPSFLSSSPATVRSARSEEHTSELQSQSNLVCRLLLAKKKTSKDAI